MPTRNFDQGALVRVYGVFTNSAGTAIDPTTVKIAYRADAIGTTTIWTYGTDAQVIRSATGTYYADIDSNEAPGRYEWNIYSVGTGQAADNGDFYIRRVLTTPAPPSDPITTLNGANVTFLQAGAGAVTRSIRDKAREWVTPQDFGAVMDGKLTTNDASIASGTTTLTSSSIAVADSGKNVVVFGAGVGAGPLAATMTVTAAGTATLSVAASTTVTNGGAYWATDDTSAIAAAALYCGTFGFTLRLLGGIYGATTIRLYQGQHVMGSGINNTKLVRLGLGSGGTFIGMVSGQVADHMKLHDFTYMCGAFGSPANGLDLGTQTPGTTDFAFGSIIENVHGYAASGIGFRLQSNAGRIANIWVSNFPGTGLADAVSVSSSQAFSIEGSTLEAHGIAAEGRYEDHVINLAANFSNIRDIHCELTGTAATKDILNVSGNANSISDLLALNHSTSTPVRRDLVRLESSATFFDSGITAYQNSGGGSLTISAHLTDTASSITITSATAVQNDYNPKTSNIYTPTLTNVANVSASTAYSCQWFRRGQNVTVSGLFDVDPTTTLTGTNLAISLPVSSNFSNASHVAGTANSININSMETAGIFGDTTNKRAIVQWTPVSVANNTWSFQFTYRIT